MKKITQLSILFGLFTTIGLFMYSCANIGSISGGDKDSLPPVLVASRPVPADTSFKSEKVIITFNEFFEFKDINEEFYSSPPFMEMPEFKIKKKNGIIKFKEPLKDSITYTLYFGNAIADFNEGNILKNFSFVFSTYSVVDSFSISGNLKNAFDYSVPENTYVAAFDTYSDSVVIKEIPKYISKIDSSGNFSINHIKPGKYKIFALSDLNGNKKADEFENRAFLDSLIVPYRNPFTKVDSLKAGTILHDIADPTKKDSLENDSVIVTSSFKNKPSNLQLYLFKEDNINQKILDYSRPIRSKLGLIFQLPVGDEFSVYFLNDTIAKENLLIEKTIGRDTISLWCSDTLAIKKDTLIAQITFLKKDSLGVFQLTNDTIEFAFREKKADDAWKKKQKKTQEVKKEYLNLTFLAAENKIDMDKSLIIESPTPLITVDTSMIKLFEIKDTSVIDTKEQKIEKAFRLKKDFMYIKFKRPIAREFRMEGANFKNKDWYSLTPTDSNRVYLCHILKEDIAMMDTLKIMAYYDNHFFMEQIQHLSDSLDMPLTSQKILSRKRAEPSKIDLVLYKPQNTRIEIIPEDFSAKGNFFQIKKNTVGDSISIILSDKKVSDKDTLTFTLKCFDYIGLDNDSVFFKETMRVTYKDKPQYLVSINRPKKEVFKLVFNKTIDQNPEIIPLSFTINNKWLDATRNKGGDTLSYTITDKFVSDIDTLKIIINYKEKDRKGELNNLADTVNLITKNKIEIKAKTEVEKKETFIIQKQIVPIYLPEKYKLTEDSAIIRRRHIIADWKSNTKYVLRYDSLAFVDFFNIYPNSGSYEFATRELDFYAKLTLSLKNILANDSVSSNADLESDSTQNENDMEEKIKIPLDEIKKYLGEGNIILQLIGDNNIVLREFNLSKDTDVVMDFLHPGKYAFKIIFDRNKNGKWDTGNYLKHVQPERVIMSGKQIDVKSKFEKILEWNVGEYLIDSFSYEPLH